ncbi:thrombospondin [Micromonospora soli]|uniref:thrombospondin n=1 Tax=Micromonospora sp. NBRC 110009 TaxID=3061627 RepID=UPI002673CBAD|nr:thrombospondin [Micromonospora sp. NBRC 110009]WKU01936.1 thrombospondin [Micromonospora sp. NBRC 110009]
MKILSRRSAPARSEDVDGDGVVDARDRVADRVDGQPVVTDRDADRTTYRSGATVTEGERATDAERRAHARVDDATRTHATTDPDPTLERTVDLDGDGRPDRAERADVAERTAPVALGPRPRTSLLATLGLIVSVVGALFVLSGTLAGYGVGLGAVGAVLAVLGLIATRRRHVAGTTDALIGVVVGLAAVVLGVVALTGQFDWPTTDGAWVGRFREWLDSQFANWF